MRFPEFCGSSYALANPVADAELTINRYVRLLESPGAKTRATLEPCPGFRPFATVDRYPVRGLFTQNDRTFVVADDVLYELHPDGTWTARGQGLTNDDSPVTICSNGEGGGQLFLVSGSRGYLYDLGANTLTQVLDPANFGGFLDGRFLALDIATSQLRISDLFDGSTWDPTQFAQRTYQGDSWRALIVAHRQLWLFGAQTSEVWYNAGTSPFPFAPTGTSLDVGIAAPYSLALVDNAPVWLGQTTAGGAVVYRGGGDVSATRISDHALEDALSGYATLADAIGWTYQERGSTFYVLTFPAADVTWVWDAQVQRWHQRGFWHSAAVRFERLRGQFHAYAFGTHLVGDRITGTVYEMSSDVATDVDGAGLRWVRRTPHVSVEGTLLFGERFELDLETGVGALTGQGTDPVIALRISRDGGRTWGAERTARIGKQGAYRARARWTRLGCWRDAVFEVSGADPVPVRLVDAFLDVRQGR